MATQKANRLKRKLDKNVSYEDLLEGWTQCCFLIPHKLRLCNMARNPNSQYCGNHIQEAAKKAQKEGSSTEPICFEDERVPCPLDGTHTVFKKSLENHLKICNAAKLQKQLALLPYYKENCNGGENAAVGSSDDLSIDMELLLKKIDKAYESIQCFVPTSPNHISTSPKLEIVHNKIRETIGKDQSSFKQVRHVDQDIHLVDQLIAFDLLASSASENQIYDTNRIVLEFGAGKGLLGLSAYLADPNISLYLVERSSNRKKIDRFFNITEEKEKATTDLDPASNISTKREKMEAFERIRMDIRNCYLPKLPKIDKILSNDESTKETKNQVTIIAKHLCGVASDLAIRSLANIPVLSDRKRCMRGLGLATCCHHCCTYEDYTGHAFLSSHDITSRKEFELLKHWSGWATLDRALANNTNNKVDGSSGSTAEETTNPGGGSEHTAVSVPEQYRPKSLDPVTMKEYGRKVKRLLDYGRLSYVQKALDVRNISMVQYCDETLSPECFMLLARD